MHPYQTVRTECPVCVEREVSTEGATSAAMTLCREHLALLFEPMDDAELASRINDLAPFPVARHAFRR